MVTFCPVPSIVSPPASVTSGKDPPSIIVPLTLKLMVSAPLPGMQSGFVAALLLAFWIALRSVQFPSTPVLSNSELTVRAAEYALGAGSEDSRHLCDRCRTDAVTRGHLRWSWREELNPQPPHYK